MKNVTLADIAKATGYSVNTVSHALNDKPDISVKTKQYIRSVAQEMGYIANTAAAAMRSGRSKSVAIIVGDISNPHFSIIIKEMEATLRAYGYNAIIMNTDEDEDLERAAIISAVGKSVDGILLCPVQKSTRNIEFMQKLKVPFILVGRKFNSVDTHYVINDDVNGGFVAADYLIENGHRNILFLNAPDHISSAKDRLEGVRRAFESAPNAALSYAEITPSSDLEPIRTALVENAACTAIICFSDLVAMQVCHILKQQGKCVPADVSIIGFDNIASKFALPLMITSVSSSKTKMSIEAVRALMDIINQPTETFYQQVLPTKIVERESTKAQ